MEPVEHGDGEGEEDGISEDIGRCGGDVEDGEIEIGPLRLELPCFVYPNQVELKTTYLWRSII